MKKHDGWSVTFIDYVEAEVPDLDSACGHTLIRVDCTGSRTRNEAPTSRPQTTHVPTNLMSA